MIVKAIEEFLDREEQSQWHQEIFNWQGVPDLEFDLELDRNFWQDRGNIF